MNTLNFQDCTLHELIHAISIAENIAKLTDVSTIEVYIHGTFKDRDNELVFCNTTWYRLLNCTHLTKRNKYFTIVVDGENTLVTPIDTLDIKINI